LIGNEDHLICGDASLFKVLDHDGIFAPFFRPGSEVGVVCLYDAYGKDPRVGGIPNLLSAKREAAECGKQS
jgi:hypothetical protein